MKLFGSSVKNIKLIDKKKIRMATSSIEDSSGIVTGSF